MNSHTHILIIHLAKLNIPVTLIEKNYYPKHKVCGEYISNEVVPYLQFLGVDFQSLHTVTISELEISTIKGKKIESRLPLGGFGISRYTLDHYLWNMARKLGVRVIQDQAISIEYADDIFRVETVHHGSYSSDYLLGAYGKRSILDKNLDRGFSHKKSPWLAVKAHYKADFDPKKVALHNFEGGYCGLSMVENNRINACYLVSYNSFKKHKDIASFQKKVMYQNPNLKEFFTNATIVFDKPITISQINFDKKKPVENHVFMIGDSAGLIHPLCGNGMAMAIQSSQILCELLGENYKNKTYTRDDIERLYTKQWNATFSRRLYAGRVLQKILLNQGAQQIAQRTAHMIPAIVPRIIKQTHGKPLVCP